MKRKAATEDDVHVLRPVKKAHLTPWQQHLKNYSKTEGMYPF